VIYALCSTIGNGFDIGLGLKTACRDFINEYKDGAVIHSEGCDERKSVEHKKRAPDMGRC